MATYYLYNASGSELALNDIALILEAGGNIQITSNMIDDNFLVEGGDLETNINSGNILLSDDAGIPPATSYTAAEALEILSLKTFAREVYFDNSTSSLASSNVQEAIIEAASGGIASNALYFDAYNTVEDDISSGWTDVPLNVEREKDSPFVHSTNSPELEVNEDFKYFITATVGIFQNGGNARSNAQMRLMLNTGSGYSFVEGTLADIYSRSNAQGEGNATVTTVLDLNSGDKIKIQAQRESGTGTIFLKASTCSLTVAQLRGQKGEKGDTGPAGTQGVDIEYDGTQVNTDLATVIDFTGSPIDSITETSPGEIEVSLESRLQIKENDSLVTDTPHSIINFKGNGVSSISTGDQVDIEIQGIDNFEEIINSIRRNIAVNSLEIQSVLVQQINENLSFFVDSFNNEDLIDASSSNYNVNYGEGYVELTQGGTLNYTETTESDFDLGTFTNTESFIDVGENGEIRKILLLAGGSVILEDFEDTTNVYYNTKDTIIDQNFDDGTVGTWVEHLLSNQWDSGIRDDYAIGSYGYKLNANDWIESNTFNGTGKSSIKVKFYANTSELLTGDTLMCGFYDGSTWQVIESIGPSQDGYFLANVNNAYLGIGNKIAFDISDSDDFLDNDFAGYVNDSAFIDEVEVYQEVQNQLSQESDSFIVYDGTYSGKYNVNFIIRELNQITIDLTSEDISLYDIIKLRLRKPDDGIYKYQIELLDDVANSWQTAELSFTSSTNWFEWSENISNITGIDKTDVHEVKVKFIEDTSDAEVFDEMKDETSTDNYNYTGAEIIQTFTPASNIKIGRIKMWFRRNSNAPRTPFYIAIANPFGTTYTYATFTGDQVPSDSDFIEAIAQFDSEIILVADQEYRLIVENDEGTWAYQWRYQETTFDSTFGTYYINGNDQSNDISFSLLSPLVNETIYIDNLELQGNSTYETTGSYLSSEIDLGINPDSIDMLYWTQIENDDDIEIRVKFASTQAGLSGATWSSWLTDSTGEDLGSLTPGKWFQYEIRWINGISTSTGIVRDVTLEYSISGGGGNAIVISTAETTSEAPTNFMLITTEDLGATGSIQYFVTRNGGTNWQLVSSLGQLIDFTS